jgi:hypothetical protein
MSTSKQDVAEFVAAFASNNPLCRFQSASGETLAVTGGVSQRDGVGGGIETDFVRSRMTPRAVGAGVDSAVES